MTLTQLVWIYQPEFRGFPEIVLAGVKWGKYRFVMLETPKDRYQSDPQKRDTWKKLVRSAQVVEAFDTAALQMLSIMPTFTERFDAPAELAQYRALCNQLRMEGAALYRNILEDLGEIPKPATKENIHALNPNA